MPRSATRTSTSSISRTKPARRRSSSCATRSCCRRSRRRPRISTSSRTRRACACGSASTAFSKRRCGRRSSCVTRSRRVSRSWRRSTLPSAGGNKEMDFRVSVLPTLYGEKIVMRLLDKSNLQLDMTKLGFDIKPLGDFKVAIKKPYGMVLVTGPTGSGKTTTLYSALSELNTIDTNISTAEDPVEFNLHGINQVQMHEDIGLNFATALRAFLRQDPNIIMVGEIRDFETAEIAVKAALTGHLVLSTLHTNDAPSTVSRLLNMGIEPFLVTASLNAIVAQRLCRRLCNECKKPGQPEEQALLDAGFAPEEIGKFQVFEPAGCKTC